ncbi:MAG: transposase [Bacteroidia bacterium]
MVKNRQNHMGLYGTYFYTETIENFSNLLADDNIKMIVIDSIKYLVKNALINLYGYVIMSNHIHLLWSMLKMNGKETSSGSLSIFTAHEFRKYLIQTDLERLKTFASTKIDRKYQFWKRDPLAIPITSETIFEQKLDYIHNNPLKEKWQLCHNPNEYRWSSAKFYMDGIDEFNFLKHYRDE